MIMNAFYDYVQSFYGKHGVYPIKGATRKLIVRATDRYLGYIGIESFGFDTYDREKVRDILFDEFHLVLAD